MILSLSIALGLVLTAISAWRIKWGLYILVALLPFERIGSWALNPDSGHPVVRASQIAGAALVLGFGLRWLARREQLRRPGLAEWLLGAFGASAGVSALLVGQRSLLRGLVALWFVIVLSYVLYCLAPRIQWRKLAMVLGASAGVVAVFGLYQFVTGALGWPAHLTGLSPNYQREIFGFPRVQSVALEPLYFANYLLLPLGVLGLMTLVAHGWWRRLTLALLCLVSLAFVLTMSRGAFIAALVAGVAVAAVGAARGAITRQRLRQALPLATILGGGILGGALLVAAASWISTGDPVQGPRQFAELVTTRLTKTVSFTERADTREQALQIFAEHPVFGVGITGISPYLMNYPGERRAGDIIALNNQATELLAEAGLVGAGLFYAFLAALLVRAFWLSRTQSAELKAWQWGLGFAVCAMTIQAQSFSGFLLTYTWVCYGLLAGISGKPQKQGIMKS